MNLNVSIDNDGFLSNPSDWSEIIAREMAADDGFDINDEHLRLIHEARAMYERDGVVPPLRRFCKDLGVTKDALYGLFLTGPMKLICKYGGLPKPTGCT
ncbi:MAG: TusE/DsrC/DsvC family sulfur relay protein [Magnetospirillum sp. WYHS-4]